MSEVTEIQAIHGLVTAEGGRHEVLVREEGTGRLLPSRSGRPNTDGETSFHLGYDRFSRLGFLSQFVVDSTGTRVDRWTHYFAGDGRTIAFEDQVGRRGSQCAYELRQRRRIFFDRDFREVRQTATLLNEDDGPVPLRNCKDLVKHGGEAVPHRDSLLRILHGFDAPPGSLPSPPALTAAEIDALVKRIAAEYSAIQSAVPAMTGRQHAISGTTGPATGQAVSYSEGGNVRMITLSSAGSGVQQVWELYYLNGELIFAFARGTPASGAATARELRFHFDNGHAIRAREADRLLSITDPAVRERALSVLNDARVLYQGAGSPLKVQG